MAFPSNPNNGQKYTRGNVTYRFEGRRWKIETTALAVAGSGGGTTVVANSDVLPANSTFEQGDMIYHASNETIYVWKGDEWGSVAIGSDQPYYTPPTVDYILVAGGGAGGSTANSDDRGGAGGAGGVVTQNGTIWTGVYAINIGAGGAKSPTASNVRGNNGEDSTITTPDSTVITAIGGGGGGGGRLTGSDGGSGGGGGAAISSLGSAQFVGGTGLQPTSTDGGFGNDGGQGGTDNSSYRNGAGGGGAGGVGASGFSSKGDCDGGLGIESTLTGTSVFYASGGAGDGGEVSPGGGGLQHEDALPNTGGGGGGASSFARIGGAGGSGVCVIRSTGQAKATNGLSIIESTYTDAGVTYYVYTFNDSGTITF